MNSWIFMISQSFLGNLVYLIHPPKICAGLDRRNAASEVFGENARRTQSVCSRVLVACNSLEEQCFLLILPPVHLFKQPLQV